MKEDKLINKEFIDYSENSYDPDELKEEEKKKKERQLQKEEVIDNLEDCDISLEEQNKKMKENKLGNKVTPINCPEN